MKKFSEVWSRPGGDGPTSGQVPAYEGVTGASATWIPASSFAISVYYGAQNAIISSIELDPTKLMERWKCTSNGRFGTSSTVSTSEAYEVGGRDASYRVALMISV